MRECDNCGMRVEDTGRGGCSCGGIFKDPRDNERGLREQIRVLKKTIKELREEDGGEH